MIRLIVALFATALVSSCCCKKSNGALYIIPEWEAGSGDQYLDWMMSNDPLDKDKIVGFNKAIKKRIHDEFGDRLPKAEIRISKEDALELALLGSALARDDSRDDVEPWTESRGNRTADELQRITEKIQEMLTKEARTLTLATDGAPIEVNYVVEDGVTYCVYRAWVAQRTTAPSADDGGYGLVWWTCTYPEAAIPEERQVTAFLNLFVVVREVD